MSIFNENYTGKLEERNISKWRAKLFIIIFGTNTRAGKLYDVVLLWVIVISILAVMMETVESVNSVYHPELKVIEWITTILFTFDYITRILVVKKPINYTLSFFGIVDLLSILPAYLGIFIIGSQSLSMLRALRLLRLFRILKLVRFTSEAEVLANALKQSRHKITVFFLFVLTILIIMGSIMYLVEGGRAGFTSIPTSIYWAIVTLTTVGFGDITPATITGQTIASIIMLLGYSIIAIPTGIVGTEFAKEVRRIKSLNIETCQTCGWNKHDIDALYCKKCGTQLIQPFR